MLKQSAIFVPLTYNLRLIYFPINTYAVTEFTFFSYNFELSVSVLTSETDFIPHFVLLLFLVQFKSMTNIIQARVDLRLKLSFNRLVIFVAYSRCHC